MDGEIAFKGRKNTMFDICIVGCGIAGLNLARLLQDKMKVLLIDKRTVSVQENMIDQGKLCGGLLAPDAQKEFAVQGLSIPVDVLVNPQIFAVDAIDLQTGVQAIYQRFYINTDRAKLDQWFYSISCDRVELWENTLFQSYVKQKDHYDVTVRRNGKKQEFSCKILVGADGATSRMARISDSKKDRVPEYISVQGAFESIDQYFMYYSFFDKRLTDFYGWMIPKGDKIVIGFAVSKEQYRKDSFDTFVNRVTESGIKPGKKLNERSTWIARPGLGALPHGSTGDIPLIGEAGGFISTSSAEGISYAMKTSYYLYRAIMTDREQYCRLYEKSLGSLKMNVLGKILKSNVYYTPWIRNIAMKSKLLALYIKE